MTTLITIESYCLPESHDLFNLEFDRSRSFLLITCRICGGCKRNIGYGTYFSCMGTFFHPDCFCCHACGCPITEHEVISSWLVRVLQFYFSHDIFPPKLNRFLRFYEVTGGIMMIKLLLHLLLRFFLSIQVFFVREEPLSQVLF